MAPFFLNLPPCMVGIEACGGAHHWARELQALGHIPRLPAAQFLRGCPIEAGETFIKPGPPPM